MRGQIGTFVAPVADKSSPLIMERVRIAGVEVEALVDTGATTSCCRWGWFKKWSSHLGPLIKTDRTVVGVGNSPIKVKGLTRAI